MAPGVQGGAVWAGPEEPPLEELSVGDALRRAAADSGDRQALVEGLPVAEERRRWTYADLLADAERCARTLLERYEPGERIAIWAPNIPEYQLLQYGCALAGLTIVTVNPTFRPEEARYVLERSRSSAVFTVDEFRGRALRSTAATLRDGVPTLRDVVDFADWDSFVERGSSSTALPIVDPWSAAQILYTSGTTGAPKGAMLPHVGMTNNVAHAARVLAGDVGSRSVWLAVLPMFHLAGCVVAALGSVALRGVLLTVREFDAELSLRLIEEERVTTTNLVPTMMLAMLQHSTCRDRDLSSMRSVMLGGGPVPPSLGRRLESEFGITAIVGYGMTEAACISWTSRADDVELRTSTCGHALPGVEVRVADPQTGEARGFGVVGEVQTRGAHVMLGYLDDPEATAEAFTSDRWLRTGDLCSLDERGYLRIEGRAKEMIIRGGENIYPREVEDELLQEEGVAEAAVIGLPDDYYGEVVAAFVRLREGHGPTPAELRATLAQRLTGAKVPSRWFFVDEFPKTPSGKIRKVELKELWQRGAYTEPA
jgi:fatty-acyl-CoA synthase